MARRIIFVNISRETRTSCTTGAKGIIVFARSSNIYQASESDYQYNKYSASIRYKHAFLSIR